MPNINGESTYTRYERAVRSAKTLAEVDQLEKSALDEWRSDNDREPVDVHPVYNRGRHSIPWEIQEEGNDARKRISKLNATTNRRLGLGTFLAEETIDERRAKLTITDLEFAWKAWIRTHTQFKLDILDVVQMVKAMQELGYRRGMDSEGSCFYGLKLKDVEQQSQPRTRVTTKSVDLAGFFDTYTIPEQGISASKIYAAYQTHCAEQQITPASGKAFGTCATPHVRKQRTRNGVVYLPKEEN